MRAGILVSSGDATAAISARSKTARWHVRTTDRKGHAVPMKLDTLVADHIERRLLQPTRLEKIL
jgi:hypothetical protein